VIGEADALLRKPPRSQQPMEILDIVNRSDGAELLNERLRRRLDSSLLATSLPLVSLTNDRKSHSPL
jgi:hypothetical protein